MYNDVVDEFQQNYDIKHQRENSEARAFLESVGSAVNTPISTDKGFEDFVIFSFEILESVFCRRKAESNANIVLK